ncbi:2OG-Fe(II) oxygenase [Elongatibacter sediminis]|uniref:2OG-Fe(II) oxygenase n=1 Tax=Elongatibacter sediminis TaxID=3119006 RepID=A0AAW9RCV4_9GAMM
MNTSISERVDPAALGREISSEVTGRVEAWRERFRDASPFRHVVIDDFFDGAFCSELVSQFPTFDERKAINENGEIGGKATQEKVRGLGPAYKRLDDLVRGEAFRGLVGRITGISDLQYDPYYFGGGTHENRAGQDLDPHVDFNYHPVTRQHRRLNLIVYLNDTWQDDWGGSLQLHRDPYRPPAEDEIVTVTPLMNRCVIFETNEHSWHGFRRIELPPGQEHRSRRSFALYYYTDTRPSDETAQEHSTVYVERHLPERFQPGRTLDGEDMQELRVLLARRDQHLRRLYLNIQRLYGEVNRLRAMTAPPLGSGSEADATGGAPDPSTAALRARIHELEQSTSWRVTAPLRALKRLLRRQD